MISLMPSPTRRAAKMSEVNNVFLPFTICVVVFSLVVSLSIWAYAKSHHTPMHHDTVQDKPQWVKVNAKSQREGRA